MSPIDNTFIPLLFGNLMVAGGLFMLSYMLWTAYKDQDPSFNYRPENRPVVYLIAVVFFVLGVDALLNEVSLVVGHFYIGAVWRFLCGSVVLIAAVFLYEHIYKRR